MSQKASARASFSPIAKQLDEAMVDVKTRLQDERIESAAFSGWFETLSAAGP
jgi:hypothetical protein